MVSGVPVRKTKGRWRFERGDLYEVGFCASADLLIDECVFRKEERGGRVRFGT